MRNVIRSYALADAPTILQNHTTITAATTIAKSGNSSGVNDHFYRDSYQAGTDEGNQSRVIDKLNQWYFYKCAYCERFYKLDVEHYRPKGEIRGVDNELLSNTGYYWLAYEWSNLLPSCISCNREGGKVSKFPYLVGGVLVTNPTFDAAGNLDRSRCLINHPNLINELPALLHPETDLNIESYFSFEIDDDYQGIRIVGIDSRNRGKITANICKLNRQEIRRDRLQNVIKDFVSSINAAIVKLSITNDNNLFVHDLNLQVQKLYTDCNDFHLSHTLLRKYIVRSSQNFDQIVLPFIEPKFQQVLSRCFKAYTPL